ncbi:unnamed protein product [Schistocephalus solidus]|uniref:Transmembrane protein n=1 Tax=Schistocephalus solidus TaxID=70667 RepID=A0A183SJ54_SCHSO|nr:unnamed protein product [Schistocephalus solidus]
MSLERPREVLLANVSFPASITTGGTYRVLQTKHCVRACGQFLSKTTASATSRCLSLFSSPYTLSLLTLCLVLLTAGANYVCTKLVVALRKSAGVSARDAATFAHFYCCTHSRLFCTHVRTS